jgi:hypothetical protein
MPRKLRVAKVRTPALPAPSWTYALLVGADPGCRLPGWVAMVQTGYGERTADEVWRQHRDALLDEARAAGFEPYRTTGVVPAGAAFERWRAAFLAAHAY